MTMSLATDLPLAALLASGAGVVVLTSAALSAHADRHPDLPAQRWSRPLPATLARVLDAAWSRRAFAAVTLLAATAGGVALVARGTAVDGFTVVSALTWLALLAGPLYRRANPVRLFAPLATPARVSPGTAGSPARGAAPAGHDRATARAPGAGTMDAGTMDAGVVDTSAADLDSEATAARTRHAGGDRALWVAAAWCAALCAVALSTSDPRVLVAAGALHVGAQVVRSRRDPATLDPLDVLSQVIGGLAPLGRDGRGRLAWRNPLVAAAHVELPRGAVGLGAVVIAAVIARRLGADPATAAEPSTAAPLLTFALALPLVALVLRAGVIRPFFSGAVTPLVAAYGTIAAGPWASPLDTVVFVALHAVAIALLHRQAIARHDLRTARAVQFPMRIVVMASLLTGLLALVGP